MTIRRKLRFEIAKVLLEHGVDNSGLTDTLADAAIMFFQENESENPQSAVVGVVAKATGIITIPPKEQGRVEQIHVMIKFYGKQAVIDAFKWAYQKWTTTKNAHGGNYSRLNFGWVDWAQEMLMEDKTNNDPKKPQPVKIILAGGQIVDGVA